MARKKNSGRRKGAAVGAATTIRRGDAVGSSLTSPQKQPSQGRENDSGGEGTSTPRPQAGSSNSVVDTASRSYTQIMAAKVEQKLAHRIDKYTALALMGFTQHSNGEWTRGLKVNKRVTAMTNVAATKEATTEEWVKSLKCGHYYIAAHRQYGNLVPDIEVRWKGRAAGFVQVKVVNLNDHAMGQIITYLELALRENDGLAFADGLVMAGQGPKEKKTEPSVRFVRLFRDGHFYSTDDEDFDSLLVEAYFSDKPVATHCLPFDPEIFDWNGVGIDVDMLSSGSSGFTFKITVGRTAWVVKYIHSGSKYRGGYSKDRQAMRERRKHWEVYNAVQGLRQTMTEEEFKDRYADIPRVYGTDSRNEVPAVVKQVVSDHFGIPLEWCIITDWVGSRLQVDHGFLRYQKVARTLGYIYETCAIAHCDARPANITVSDSDQVYIIDWGECQTLDRSGSWTRVDRGFQCTEDASTTYTYTLTPWFLSQRQIFYMAGEGGPLDRKVWKNVSTSADDEAEFLAKAYLCMDNRILFSLVDEGRRSCQAYIALDAYWSTLPKTPLAQVKDTMLEAIAEGKCSAARLTAGPSGTSPALSTSSNNNNGSAAASSSADLAVAPVNRDKDGQ